MSRRPRRSARGGASGPGRPAGRTFPRRRGERNVGRELPPRDAGSGWGAGDL